MKNKILYILILIAIVSVAMWAETLYWRYWPFDIIEVSKIKIDHPGKTVRAGDLLRYSMDIDKKMNLPATVKRQLENSYRIDFPAQEVPAKALGRQTVRGYLQIPNFADAGVYRMTWTAEYEIGPEKRIIAVSTDSEPFTVVRCERGVKKN